MKIRRWLKLVLLGPAFMFAIIGVPGEAGEAEEDTPATLERPESISEEEWDGLSTEEREGLLMDGTGELGEVIDDEDEEDLSEEDLAAIAGGEEEEDALAEAEAAAAEAAATEAVAAEVPAAAAEPPEGDASTDADLLAYRPVITAEELRAKIPQITEVPADIQKKLDELEDRFENGWEEDGEAQTLSLREYNRERDALNRQATQAMIDAQAEARENVRADLEWDKEQKIFFAAHKEFAPTSMRGKALYGALNETVMEINNDPKNATKTGMQILIMARDAVRKEFGMVPATLAKPATPAPKKPASPLPKHKTLADTPAAHSESTSTDPFSALDRLTGEKLERALEKMSDEQRRLYESRA